MGKRSPEDKVSVLIAWAVVLMCGAAEQEDFPQSTNLTWDEARDYCQMCFKDLATLTPDNTKTITRNLTSEHWVGLRKNLSSTNSTGMFWSRWANGDPLSFQNWYPGWPVLKPPRQKKACCSCSCTCPARTTPTSFTEFTTHNATSFSGLVGDATEDATNFTALWESGTQNSTGTGGWTDFSEFTTATPRSAALPSLAAECVRSPLLSPEVPDTDENYMEDSCVAMLSFGAWVERNCSELLPFICYEDRFFGELNVTNVTSRSATLAWLAGPGNISHYRLQVRGDREVTETLTNRTFALDHLTPGTKYTVQVFPVKCERDLNPQEKSFYTIPGKVENLTVTEVTQSSVSLSWDKPAGNVDSYRTGVLGQWIKSEAANVVVGNLTPGNMYTFRVVSGVKNGSEWGDESTITAYTRPGEVSDLRVSENTNSSLLLSWVRPRGNATSVIVTATDDDGTVLFNRSVTGTEERVTELPMGTRITVNVTAVAANALEGDPVTVVSYTAPGPVSNLTLVTTYDTLTATWNSSVGNYSHFIVVFQLDGQNISTDELKEPRRLFGGLKTAAKYTVIVCVVKGDLLSPPVESCKYTLPRPPTDLKATNASLEAITLEWKPPANTATVTYSVTISTRFWGHSWSENLDNKTSYTVTNLRSGTSYEFEVRTLAGGNSSDPAITSQFTAAEKREISLSMLCSSEEVLLCDTPGTRESVFNQLQAHFNKRLGDGVFWKLEQQKTEN